MQDTKKSIHEHAEGEYPFECCGIITGSDLKQNVHRCNNLQNKMHTEDPERFPRDARTAYFIERSEFNRIIKNALSSGEKVLAFYHSHPDHEAYFSEEDHAAQTVFGEPEYPNALQIVISVISGKVEEISAYQWDPITQHFKPSNDIGS
ncbi:MAG: Mov34/MPN/PAD-1 family protein [Nitrospira sp.]|nr:Mov34/MPN/PAD-1 family protein [bacterium]MBL7049465.1 Mov34/MPN/PAD-1 family protein [Nitrospira sp.]